MNLLDELMRRTGYLGRRRQFERELDDEVRFHLEARAEELEREGLTAQEAMDRARREFGPRALMQEESRAAWQYQWIEDFWRDLVYGARAFAKNPGFTAVAILSLGIGVGANYAMFTVVDMNWLRPPNIPRANEVVNVIATAKDGKLGTISYPDYAALRDRSQSFEGLAAFTAVSIGIAPRAGAEPRVEDGKLVTSDFFDIIGVKPAMGRTFLPEEELTPGKDSVAVLSHQCWQDHFGLDPAILGKPARIDGIDFTVIGVMPPQFSDLDDSLTDDYTCFFVPMGAARRLGSAPDLLENRGQRSLTVFGRLKRGVPLARARAEAATIASTLARDYPATNRDRSITVRTAFEARAADGGMGVGAFAMILAGLILLIACANVAGLLTSRAPARAQEIAMRLAIGAGRPRLIRQLLTESLLLGAAGGLAGVVIGYIPVSLAKQLMLQFDPRLAVELPSALDLRLLGFGAALAMLSVILFGLMPAFQTTRADLVTVIKGPAPKRPSRLGRLIRGRSFLVVGQVAIALLVLTVTSVLYTGVYKGFVASVRNPGFQVDHLLGIDFDPSTVHFKDARAKQFFRDLVARTRRATEVRAATLLYQDVAVIRPDSPLAHDDVRTSGVWGDEEFFETLGIPVVQGRVFQRADIAEKPSVAIVNEVLAKRYWPGQNAVGKRIRLNTGQWVDVIGVAKIDRFMAFGTPPMDIVFLPFGAAKDRDVRLAVRSTGDPQAPAESIRRIIHELDPDQAIPDSHAVQPFFALVMRAVWLGLNTFGAMGVLALLLALVGLYGLLAYEVSSRTREIGIRMALGARAGAVVRMVLRQGIALAVFGVGAGMALNYGLVKVMQTFLGNGGAGGGDAKPPEPNGGNQISLNAGYGPDSSFNGHALAILVIAVFVVTILAAWLPARRAATVDPNVALRAE